MFTSCYKDANNYGTDPSTYNYQPMQFLNEIITSTSTSTTSNPNHDDPPPFSNFFYLPSPLLPPYSGVLMELEDQSLLLQEEHENSLFLHSEPMATSACDDSISAKEDRRHHHRHQTVYHELVQANEEEPVIGRRSSKRDRHSKITTAQGPRDRRMRLSLKVAREFFDVQDMLGFDKASKTVEWLLVQSKSSIEKLFAGVPGQMTLNYSCKSASSPSECEVISGLDEAALITGFSPKGSSKTSPSASKKPRRTSPSSARKAVVLQPLARESRAKARARARKRTLEKKWIRRLDESKQNEYATTRGPNPNQLGSFWSSAFGTGEDHSSCIKQNFNQDMIPSPPASLDALGEATGRIHQKQERLESATGCFIDDSLVIMSKWSSSSILMSHLQSTINFPQELQITDFQSMCKDLVGQVLL